MINIKKLAVALVMTIASATHAFADKDSIYDDARDTGKKTYCRLIEEAASAKLPETECTRFMSFVRAFPTKNLNNYDMTIKASYNHPQNDERLFFAERISTVLEYNFDKNIDLTEEGYAQLQKANNTYPAHGLAWHDLRFGLCGIVQYTSSIVVGTGS